MFSDEHEKDVFLNLIRYGLGFSVSCSKINKSTKDMSEAYLNDTTLKKQIDDAFKLGLIDATINYQESLSKNKDNAIEHGSHNVAQYKQILDEFISVIVLWGDGLTEMQKETVEEQGGIYIDEELILVGLSRYKNLHEVATAYGMDYAELALIVSSNIKTKHLLIK